MKLGKEKYKDNLKKMEESYKTIFINPIDIKD